MPGRLASGAPDWPHGFTGSISHTAGLAAAAAATRAEYRSVGIDVERVIPAADEAELADLVLTPDERARFSRAPVENLVTLAFSIKEAMFKALYPLTGCRFYHEDAELVEMCSDGTARVQLLRRLAPDWRVGSSLPVLWRYDANLCLSLTWVTAQ